MSLKLFSSLSYLKRDLKLCVSVNMCAKWHSGIKSTCQCRRRKSRGFDPWIRNMLWNRKWQSTPVFLPEKFHGQRSLVGYSPWCLKELYMTMDWKCLCLTVPISFNFKGIVICYLRVYLMVYLFFILFILFYFWGGHIYIEI